MPFTPFTYERHLKFLLDTLRLSLPNVDLSPGSFWQIWAQGQSRGLAGVTAALTHGLRQVLPDRAVALDLDHHATVYDLPRLQPQRATGLITGTATQPIELDSPDWELHLEDPAGRVYDIDDIELFTVPFAGTFTLSVTARNPGADGNQVTDAPLLFKPDEAVPAGLDPEARALSPGLTGGTDLETDPHLQARIVSTLSAGRLKDTAADYQRWALDTPTLKLDDESYKVAQVFVYQDSVVRNRVFLLPLTAPPDRIGPPGFCQAVFNAVERSIPVTVDPIVPVIRAEAIDVTLQLSPKSHARWDWNGKKEVVDPVPPAMSDRRIMLNHDDPSDPWAGKDGVNGLSAGKRVLINGEIREIGHVDHENHAITLTRGLSAIPDPQTTVYPGGPITELAQAAVRSLFRIVTPLHKTPVGHLSPQNVLASAITDTVMELEDVYDVEVENPEELIRPELLDAPGYTQGTLAYLATPGRITVAPMHKL
jgi:Baseplate J-like protein